ncbi:uncharacterized protein [Centruroides vittatus]|uniref:uncharacterized protein isoform X2 n=1 Tax=Centruroides vittatus TaxID=120091 RepID=UPI003510140D
MKKLDVEVILRITMDGYTKDEIPVVPFSKFRDIIMVLKVKVNGKKYDTKSLSKIIWWKDNKPIERCVDDTCIPVLYVNTPNVTKQGKYYASVIMPGYPYTIYSNAVEIYLSDVSTYLLTITGRSIPYKRRIHDYSKTDFIEFRQVVDKKMKNLFRNFSVPNLPQPFWYLSRIADTPEEVTLHIYLYLNFFEKSKDGPIIIIRPKDERSDVYIPLHNFIKNKFRMMAFSDWNVSIETLQIVGQCFGETKLGSNDINITWHDSYGGKYIVSTPPCITSNWQLVTRTCHGGYVTGSKWSEFDYSKCSRRNEMKVNLSMDKCRSSYVYWKHDTCVSVHRESTDWFRAHKICGEMKGYLFSPKLSSDTSFWEFDPIFDIGEIWMGGYRTFGTFQWLAFYPGIINTSEVSWGHGEPRINNNCLSGKTFAGKLMLYSRSCHERKPFVCMHKALYPKFYDSPRCPDNWKKWQFTEDNCYMRTKVKMNWKETQHHCKREGGKLAVLHHFDQYIAARNYVRQLNIKHSLWWIGLRKIQNNFMWDDKISYINYVDWDPSTDFSRRNTAGCLKFDGNVSWYLNNPSNKNYGICETKANKGRVVVQLSEVKTGIFKCTSDRRYYKSITWYKDGLVVNGTRGLMETNDEFLDVYKLLSSKHPHLKTLSRLQGYYWCEVDQETPFIPVSSNKELFVTEDFWTFSGEFLSRKILNPFDPSTSKFWSKIEEITKKIEDQMLPREYPTSAYIHNMSVENGKTKLMFYIYIERKRNKRTDKNDNRRKYRDKLESYIESKLRRSNIAEELQLIPESLKIRNSGECNRETTNVGGTNLTWNETMAGKFTIANESCILEKGDPVVRRCLGNFTHGSYWGPVEGTCSGRLSNISEKLKNLSQETVISPKEISENLKTLTNDSSQLKAIDLHYVAITMQNLAEVQVHQRNDVQDVISTMDNIMNMDPEIIVSSKIKVNASSRITASLENILENNIDMLLEKRPNLIVYSWSLRNQKMAGMMVMSSDGDSLGKAIPIMDIGKKGLTDEKCRAGILLPPDLVVERSLKNSSIDFVIYKNDSLFLTRNRSSKIITPVLHAHVSGGPVLLEKKTIEIVLETFKVSNQIPNSEKCVYWDYSMDNGEGDWSDKGCETKIDLQDEKHVRCSCDHMTNFAILVDLYGGNVEEENHAIALDIITYIGCTLSIFGLLVTIITFMIFKKLRKGLGSKVLCNLAVSLLLTLIVFLTGIDQISSKAGCIFVAALLHYLLLVSFSWMLVEAVLQYLRFVKVIGTYIPKFMLKASLWAWGFPLLITLTILAIDHNMYHGGKNYCWLKIKPFYFGFLIPVGIIMLSNIVIFCLVIYSISCGRQIGLRTNQSERKLAITRVRAAFCILFLLGLSWTFGFFAISDARLIFKYLFSIFTTLQGFFIFVFHVLQEKTTRDLWYEYFCPKKEHGMQTFATRDTSTAKDTTTSSNSISRNKC